MTIRPWHLLLVLAALIVPLQAGALGGGGSGLAVSASLDYCGVGQGGISCKIDTSWSGVENASRYTATVTLADGSVADMGTVGSGSGGSATSIWVPYAGNGIYTVTISAWGQEPDGKEEKLEEEDAETDVKDTKPDEPEQGEGKGSPEPPQEHSPAEDPEKPAEDPGEPGQEPAPAEEPPSEDPTPEPGDDPAPGPADDPAPAPAAGEPGAADDAGAPATATP